MKESKKQKAKSRNPGGERTCGAAFLLSAFCFLL
jgi:hypothetical protein